MPDIVNCALDLGFVPDREHTLPALYQPIVIKYLIFKVFFFQMSTEIGRRRETLVYISQKIMKMRHFELQFPRGQTDGQMWRD